MPKCILCIEICRYNQYCEKCMNYFKDNKVKYCANCLKIHPWKNFYKSKNSMLGLSSYCFLCSAASNLHTFLRRLIDDAKSSSKKRREKRVFDEPFDIYLLFLEELWEKQEGKCALSGIPMNHRPHCDFKCSIDRIDNNKDYIKGNVRLVICELNTRNQWTHEKIKYLREYDKKEHSDIKEITTRIKELPLKKDDGTCRTCANILHPKCNSYCKSCYERRDLKTVLTKFYQSCIKTTKNRNAKENRENTECTITIEELWNQLQKQQGKCYYSGINMTFDHRKDWRISLERLNVFDGYNKDNVVFICQEFNTGDRSVLKSRYEKSGSCGWSKEKVQMIL